VAVHEGEGVVGEGRARLAAVDGPGDEAVDVGVAVVGALALFVGVAGGAPERPARLDDVEYKGLAGGVVCQGRVGVAGLGAVVDVGREAGVGGVGIVVVAVGLVAHEELLVVAASGGVGGSEDGGLAQLRLVLQPIAARVADLAGNGDGERGRGGGGGKDEALRFFWVRGGIVWVLVLVLRGGKGGIRRVSCVACR